jgi:hypothetical protein
MSLLLVKPVEDMVSNRAAYDHYHEIPEEELMNLITKC